MFHRISRILAICAAVQLLGGHWLALQSVAWVGMLANYSQSESFVGALEKTFDGDHPCDLCKVVKSGRETEQRQEAVVTAFKLDAVVAIFTQLPLPDASDYTYPPALSVVTSRMLAPPTPPPQVA